MTPTDADLLAVVERSPDAAARHDRAGWVGLFTRDARVEDPVGSRPHVGHAEIGRFYDTFIGPRQVTFHRDLDIVNASTVVRDLDLEVTMSRSLTMTIPAVLRYDVAGPAGALRIAGLRAYWELPAMVVQFLRNGASAVPAGIALSRALMRHQRVGGAVGFAAGFRQARHGNGDRVRPRPCPGRGRRRPAPAQRPCGGDARRRGGAHRRRTRRPTARCHPDQGDHIGSHRRGVGRMR
jgi:hypothetical protein